MANWNQCSWERGAFESDDDYQERIADLNAYRDYMWGDN